MDRVGIGIIGCGNISPAYLKAAQAFPDPRRARRRRHEPGGRRGPRRRVRRAGEDASPTSSPTRRSRSSSTSPSRRPMSRSASRRSPPASTSIPRSRSASTSPRRASSSTRRRRRGVRVGCAPDTFLGGAHQTCRKLIDEGAIGKPLAGTAFFMCPGHERWHPSPAFYYLARRRADARHGALLHHRPRQPARPGRRASPASPRGCAASASITSEPLEGHEDPGRGRDPRRRHAGIRLRRRWSPWS